MPLRHARHVLAPACVEWRSSAATQGSATLHCTSIPWRHWREPLQWTNNSAKVSARGAKRLAVCRVEDLPTKGPGNGSSPKVRELPQGLIDAGPPENHEDVAPVYPALLQQVRNHMIKYEGSVLLTKVGQFYELYFEHAEKYGPLLGLKVATKKTNVGPVAMAGFQTPYWNRYLKILVQDLHKQVAIAEEVPNDATGRIKSGGLLFNREVKRIVSAGTLIDENFISPFENNYLLAVHVENTTPKPGPGAESSIPAADGNIEEEALPPKIGLAWIDLTSGVFFTQYADLSVLPSAIARIAPREVVLSHNRESPGARQVISMLRKDGYAVSLQPSDADEIPVTRWSSYLEASIPDSLAGTFTKQEIAAGSAVLRYVDTHLKDRNLKLKIPLRYEVNDFMSIDRNTLRALEIRTTLRDGALKGSLLHAVRRTVTPSGSRLLNERLLLPSLSLKIITERLDMVEMFLRFSLLRDTMISLLRQTYDITRLVQKFSLGRGEADDLLDLAKSIGVSNQIAAVLEQHVNRPGRSGVTDSSENATRVNKRCLEPVLERFKLEGPNKLAEGILQAIDEEGLSASQRLEEADAVEMAPLTQAIIDKEAPGEEMRGFVKKISLQKAAETDNRDNRGNDDGDVWIMRRSASSTLQRLHESLDALWAEKSRLGAKLKDELDIPSLSLRWTPGLGHHVHVRGKRDLQRAMSKLANAQSVSNSRSTHSLHYTEWTDLGGRIDATKLQIRAEEQRVFRDLREQVVCNLVKLRRTADVLDEIDVACAFATVAQEQNFTRPILTHSTTHNIYGGRHPMVEVGLTEQGRNFAPNDCLLGDDERIWLITGPNMGGKSTFLRQNALISVLAQTGSFVPADYAEIGLVDKIFSRVGSADNLYQDQSTFMVEMLETAEILKQATPYSFVIMDEVGRGTTPEDGVAVGYACLHHLHHTNRCRTLFATHFHVLADKTNEFQRLACYCNDVVEDESGNFSYAHKMRKGVNRESHALKVARMAGLPEAAIKVAREELEKMRWIKGHGTSHVRRKLIGATPH